MTFEQQAQKAFPLGTAFVDLDQDYGFRPAYAIELRTADDKWMRFGVKLPKGGDTALAVSAMQTWLEARLTRKVQAVSNG